MQTLTVYPTGVDGFLSYEVWWTDAGELFALRKRSGEPASDAVPLYSMLNEGENLPVTAAIGMVLEDIWPTGHPDGPALQESAELIAGLGNIRGGLDIIGDVVETLPGDRRLLPLPQAARHLGIGESTLRKLIRAGTIQHRKLGGLLFLLWPDDFDATVEAAVVLPKTP